MAQICEKRKIDRESYYHWPIRRHRREAAIIHKGISFPSKISHPKRIEVVHDIFEPIKIGFKKDDPRVHWRNLKKILEIEKQLLDMSLEESSLELCSKLRASVGLSDEYEADETALADLDSFLADLAGEEVDASEVVRDARRRL